MTTPTPSLVETTILQLQRDLAAAHAELREITEAVDDPRTHNTHTIAEVVKSIKSELEERERDSEEAKNYRSALLELRVRFHAAGRRPEECHEMSLIDAAIAEGK